MGKLFIDCKNLSNPSQSKKMDHPACPRFRFWPQKHQPGHQFDGRVIRIVQFDPFEYAGSLPGTIGCNIIDLSAMASTWCHKLITCLMKKSNVGTVPAGEKYEGTMAL